MKLSEVGKSYVGGGQFRSLSSLSPRARKVVRRNLEARRAGRGGFGSSPQQKTGDMGLVMNSTKPIRDPQVSALRDAAQAARKTVPTRQTSVRNMTVTQDTSPSVQRMLEREFKGRKLRNPVQVDAGASNLPGYGGYAVDAPDGRAKRVVLQRGTRGYDRRAALHEMQHAQGGSRKGRLSTLALRKNPRRSLQREEARADAATFDRGQRRVASSYADMWGDDSTYGRELKRQLGRQPRHQSMASALRSTSAHYGQPIPKGEVRDQVKGQLRPILQGAKARGGAIPDMTARNRAVTDPMVASGAAERRANRKAFFGGS